MPQKTIEQLKQIVRDYYVHIDSERLEQAVGLFATNAIYRRNKRVLRGIREIEDFYLLTTKEIPGLYTVLEPPKRKLVGKHIIDEIVERGPANITVLGRFQGDKNFGFTDTFRFNKGGKIVSRRTTTTLKGV